MNELNPKISVIVPVYKAEAYLHRCVDSLLAQTFQNFEILLIDDGSPDRSGEICDEYAKKDKRIRVFHKENGGVSSARQCGMDNARGEYTIHADPDDWVEPDMLQELYGKAKAEDADMVICDFYYEKQGKSVIERQKPSSLKHTIVLSELFFKLHGSSWNKLIRREYFNKSGIKYPLELFYCEDLFVNACLLINDIRISYLPKVFYHYDVSINENSLIRKPLEIIFRQEQILYKLLKEKLPVSYFEVIEFKILPMLAYKALCIGSPYLKTFRSDYKSLRSCVNQLEVSMKLKLLLMMAFQMSPNIIHTILRFKHYYK